jgi:ketosteroid isomerase-like protein
LWWRKASDARLRNIDTETERLRPKGFGRRSKKMRKLIVTMVLVVIGAGLVCSAGNGEAADKAAIAALWVAYGQSRNDGDADRRLAIHDPEALKMPQDRPMFRMADVADKLQANWAKQDEASTTEMYVEPHEIIIMGDYAYSMGTYRKKVTPKAGGESTLYEGKFLTILRKDAKGKWVIYRDCYNSNKSAAVSSTALTSAQYTFGTPVNLGPKINSDKSEGSPRISADGLELYFNSNRPGGYGGADLWVATRPSVDAEWREPVNLGPIVNSSANEIAPTISADGLELYFSDYRANRPGGIGKSDIWVTKRRTKSSDWGEPVNLGSLVNTPSDEITPDISANGLELYFETDRPGGLGSDDLWVAKRATRSADWGRPVWLGKKINAEGMDHCPNITSDGLTLFFDYTPPGEKVGDLMVVRRATIDSDWGEPVNLGRAVSGHFASSISSDGRTLYFASRYPGGYGANDIWQVPIQVGGKPVSK